MKLYFLHYSALSIFSTQSLQLRDPDGAVLVLLPCTGAGKRLQGSELGHTALAWVVSLSEVILVVNCLVTNVWKKSLFYIFSFFVSLFKGWGKSSPYYSILAGKRIFHYSFGHELYVIQLYNVTFPLCLCFRHLSFIQSFIYTKANPKGPLYVVFLLLKTPFPPVVCSTPTHPSDYNVVSIFFSGRLSEFSKLSNPLLYMLIACLHTIYLICNFTFVELFDVCLFPPLNCNVCGDYVCLCLSFHPIECWAHSRSSLYICGLGEQFEITSIFVFCVKFHYFLYFLLYVMNQ